MLHASFYGSVQNSLVFFLVCFLYVYNVYNVLIYKYRNYREFDLLSLSSHLCHSSLQKPSRLLRCCRHVTKINYARNRILVKCLLWLEWCTRIVGWRRSFIFRLWWFHGRILIAWWTTVPVSGSERLITNKSI